MSEQITDERLKRIFECCSGKSHFAVGEFVKINEGALMAKELLDRRANAKTAPKPTEPEKVDSKHDKTTEQIVCGSCLHYDLNHGKCTFTGTTGIMHLTIGCNDWHPIPDDSKPEKVEAKVDKKFFRGTKKWIPNGYAKVVSGIIAETIGWNGLIGGEWMGTCDGEDPSWFEISAADYEAAKTKELGGGK